MANILSVPALILFTSMMGFGALARDSGMTLGEASLATALIWALPSQVILANSAALGTGLAATALAVALSAVRLLPMTVALMPVLRDRGTARWQLYLASHFVAVTGWVFAMRWLPEIPRRARLPFFLGFVLALLASGVLATVTAYFLAGSLPRLFAAGLVFVTPLYFLMSLFGAARIRADKLALLLGLVVWAPLERLAPSYGLVLTGLIAGSAAFLVHRLGRQQPAKGSTP
jgi:predicted branched-subunit amino acid permease